VTVREVLASQLSGEEGVESRPAAP
jgi:hypothetical protein